MRPVPYDEGIFNLVEMVNLNPNNKNVYTDKYIFVFVQGRTKN